MTNRYESYIPCGFFSIKTFAHEMRLHEMCVYRMAKKGKIKATKVGGQWRIPRAELDDYMLRNSRGTFKLHNLLDIPNKSDLV